MCSVFLNVDIDVFSVFSNNDTLYSVILKLIVDTLKSLRERRSNCPVRASISPYALCATTETLMILLKSPFVSKLLGSLFDISPTLSIMFCTSAKASQTVVETVDA